MVIAVINGVAQAWLLKRKVHTTYDLSGSKPEIKVGKRTYSINYSASAKRTHVSACGIDSASIYSATTTRSLYAAIQASALICLEIEVNLVRKCPGKAAVYYPVIVNDDQVVVKGIGTGMRTCDGDVNVYLEDGTSIILDKSASVVTCDDTDYALFRTKKNSGLPYLPSNLRCKLGQANAVIGQLMHA